MKSQLILYFKSKTTDLKAKAGKSIIFKKYINNKKKTLITSGLPDPKS